MIEDAHPAVNVLLLVAFVAPVAVYFLMLGLVNSHATPRLVSCRDDFVALTGVMIPFLIAPVPALARAALWWVIVLEAGLAAYAFFALLPGRHAGWVIYNIGSGRGRELVRRCVAELGWGGEWRSGSWSGASGRLHVTSLSVLRNITVHVELHSPEAESQRLALRSLLEERLSRVQQLPSATGACMLLLGVGMLSVPIWIVGRHIEELVEAVVHLFG